ncbi:MAG: YbdD/YjiX family protein [Gemmatimonadota bacterium]|nr:YbdD/YjiX family protein [Gemmatimonadota bacterium]
MQSCLTTFRRVVGMPDYSAYLEHLSQRHPDWPVPSEQEFFQVYVETRYGGGVSRCC